jgi:amino acid transporter
MDANEKTFLKKAVPFTAFIAGLCCFTPVVLVLFGLSSVTFAASLADTLYGTYKWVFRGVALALMLGALFWYYYKKEKVCTIDEFKKRRRKIINFTLIVLITGILAYIFWLYVVVEIIGISLGIWG